MACWNPGTDRLGKYPDILGVAMLGSLQIHIVIGGVFIAMAGGCGTYYLWASAKMRTV